MAYESKFKRDDIDELFRAVLLLEDEEDCYRFFEDICTINEIHSISQRLQVAKLLSENKTYSEIERITKASTATISRINKCLVYGAEGYKRILDRMKEQDNK
ncbi:MAG: YerC/YecD family TrpR-related protein [Lentihominibacter sp.]|nr:YerC/YecD family TrpR-related protein [Clostridiales bacterium]MDD6647118.1 YerC/YecD family TrpR-related protein [Bacillota bacterium]